MAERKIFVLNDEFIAQLQNLVTYSIVTGTNVVDHLRQLRLEEGVEKQNSLVLTPEYVEYYERTLEQLKSDLQKMQEEQQTLLASDDGSN